MIEGLFSSANYQATKKWMDATAMNQLAVTHNLNHIETPGYRRLRVSGDFQAELRRAAGAGHADQLRRMAPTLEKDPQVVAQRKDGNTVSLEHELMEFQKNSLSHAYQVQALSAHYSRLRLAITGRGF